MKKLLLAGFIIVAFFRCDSENNNKQTKIKKDIEIAKKVESLISEMTLEEKIVKMTQVASANKCLEIPYMKCEEVLHGLWF